MNLAATIKRTGYRFASVKEVLAKANPPKSGDLLAGVAAEDAIERVAARAVLAGLTLKELRESPVVPYEEDELTRLVEDSLDENAFAIPIGDDVGQRTQVQTTTAHEPGRGASSGSKRRAHSPTPARLRGSRPV